MTVSEVVDTAESKLDEPGQELSKEEMRDCYYILRAMHDGACPKCGFLDEVDHFFL